MLGPIAWIAAKLIARNPALTMKHARRLGWVIAIGVALAVAAGGFSLWLHFHDNAVIERADTTRQLDEAKAALEAGHRADTAGAVRDESRTAASAQTKAELETIHAQDPNAAAAPASRGTRAVARRLPTENGQ